MGSLPSIEVASIPEEFSETIAHFIKSKHQIESQTLDTIIEKLGRHIHLENIQEANEFLAQDIIAALSLGDLSLVGLGLFFQCMQYFVRRYG